ncbi:MAG TPA: N-acyl homoserine lactonase family protein [Phycisphaerae bacterium]|nr:N-acyl homoserine lactonase family protein [Phycisphaerae bacterium]
MYKIYPLKVAEETDPGPLVFYMNNWGEEIKLFSYMWLIRGDRQTVLVDTGFTQEVADEFGPGVIQQPEEHPLRQLEKHGVKPDEIRTIILTHAHFDHLSPLVEEYTKAQFFIQAKEMSYATNPPHPGLVEYNLQRAVDKLSGELSGRVTLVEGDTEILPGINVFWTGGHTPGHQSVAVQTESGKAIITGDVVFTYKNLDDDIPVGLNTSVEECYLAMRRIRKEGDIILPGHDPLIMAKHSSGIS